MNADSVAVLLASKDFKRVQYKSNPERRKPCWYLNFKRQGKRTTRMLIYLGETDVYICWESKQWPATYKSPGTKLDYGMTEEQLLKAMRVKWRDMQARYQQVELKDRRRSGNEADVSRAMDRMAQPKPAEQPHLRLVHNAARAPQTSAGMMNQLAKSMEAAKPPKKKAKKGKKVPEEQTSFGFS